MPLQSIDTAMRKAIHAVLLNIYLLMSLHRISQQPIQVVPLFLPRLTIQYLQL